jgi:hypothetical protein
MKKTFNGWCTIKTIQTRATFKLTADQFQVRATSRATYTLLPLSSAHQYSVEDVRAVMHGSQLSVNRRKYMFTCVYDASLSAVFILRAFCQAFSNRPTAKISISSCGAD